MQTTILLVLAVAYYAHASVTVATAFVSGQGVWSVQVGKEDLQNGVAVARFYDQTFANGWAQLNITTTRNTAYDDAHQTYATGYLEGYLTQKNIFDFYPNQYQVWGFPKAGIPDKMANFMSSNLAWTREQTISNPTSPYWQTVKLVLTRFDGLVAGYAAKAPSDQKLSELELFFLNSAGDLEDLIPALMDQIPSDNNGIASYRINSKLSRGVPRNDTDGDDLSDCSALIKIKADGSDLYAGHTTWRSFGIINKMYKYVTMPNLKNPIAVSYASSPGFLSSKDDYYVTSNGLVVMETTNSLFNKELYKFITPKTVLCWLRSIVANHLATNGSSWTHYFAMHNSGSYNNQFMVLDYKKFTPGQPIKNDTLWILEQLPGTVSMADVSSVLKKQGFWKSYNIPYFVEIYNAAGYPARKAQFGDDYDYDKCPRSQIFIREQAKIDSLMSFGKVLQFNEWETDPLSKGDPGKSVSSRYDLRKENAHAFGGIDSKITNAVRVPKLGGYGICGPTHQGQPVFNWSDPRWKDYSHNGQPNEFNFTWIEFGGY